MTIVPEKQMKSKSVFSQAHFAVVHAHMCTHLYIYIRFLFVCARMHVLMWEGVAMNE
jgi:hypothetical protein